MSLSSKSDSYDTPPGWRRVVKIRKSGKTQGRKDVYLYSPENVKIRSMVELSNYLGSTNSSFSLEDFKENTGQPVFKKASKKSLIKDKAKKAVPKREAKRPNTKDKNGSFRSCAKTMKTDKFSSKNVLKSAKKSANPSLGSASAQKQASLMPKPSCDLSTSSELTPKRVSKAKKVKKMSNKPPLLSRKLPIPFKAPRAKSGKKPSSKKANQKATKGSIKALKNSNISNARSLMKDINDIFAPSTSGYKAKRKIKSPSTSTNGSRSGGSSPPLNVYIPGTFYPDLVKTKKSATKSKNEGASDPSGKSSKCSKVSNSSTQECDEDIVVTSKNDKQILLPNESLESSGSSSSEYYDAMSPTEFNISSGANNSASSKLSEKTLKTSATRSSTSLSDTNDKVKAKKVRYNTKTSAEKLSVPGSMNIDVNNTSGNKDKAAVKSSLKTGRKGKKK